MATNILSLPQISAAFVIANDADWRDTLLIPSPSGTGPLDLTGIVFKSMLRSSNGNILLTAQTTDGTMVNGLTTGMLTWAVPRYPSGASPVATSALAAGTAQLDIIANDPVANIWVNMCIVAGPASVTIIQGITT